MAVLAVGVAGAAAGAGIWAVSGATAAAVSLSTAVSIGWSVGTIIGNYLYGPGTQSQDTYLTGPSLQDNLIKGGSYGQPITKVWGKDRVAGGIIWKVPLRKETISTVYDQGGGKGFGGGGGSTTVTSFKYYATFAVQICEGEADIRRVWANSKLIRDPESSRTDIDQYMTVYPGDDTQMPDPTIETYEGAGNVPAYRHTCYVVFNDLPVEEFRNVVPALEFEVVSGEEDPPKHLENIDYTHDSSVTNKTADSMYYVDPNGTDVWSISDVEMISEPPFKRWKLHRVKQDIETQQILFEEDMDFLTHEADNADTIVRYVNGSQYLLWPVGLKAADPDWVDWGFPNQATARLNVFDITTGQFVGNPVIPAENQPGTLTSGDIYNGRLYLTSKNGGSANIIFVDVSTNWSSSSVRHFYFSGLTGGLANAAGIKTTVDNGKRYVLLGGSGGVIIAQVDNDTGVVWSDTLEGSTSGWAAQGALVRNGFLFTYATGDATNQRYSVFRVYNNSVDRTDAGEVSGPTLSGGEMFAPYRTDQVISSSGKWLAFDYLYDNNIGDIVVETCVACGMLPSQIDASLIDANVIGYSRGRVMSGRSLIDALQAILAFDKVETNGTIKFIPQDSKHNKTGITILADELAAHRFGTQAPPQLNISRRQEMELPQSVVVIYKDLRQDYDVGVHKIENQITQSRNKVSIELPAVLKSRDAKKIAKRFATNALYNRLQMGWSCATPHLVLEPSDEIEISAPDADYTVRIQSVAMTIPTVINFSGVVTDSSIYDIDEDDDDVVEPPGLPVIVASAGGYLDIPSLQNDHTGYEGHYAYAYGTGTETWPGATAYFATTPNFWIVGTYWSESRDATIGQVSTALPDRAHPWNWDDDTVVAVNITKGTLLPSTDLDVQSGANHACVGINGRWEVIGFVNVTDLGNGDYELSRLLRARCGTEHVLGTSQPGDAFVLLDEIGIRRINLPAGLIGTELKYRMVPESDRLANATDVAFTNEGVSNIPFAPVRIEGDRDSNGLHLKWTRRSRCTSDEQFVGETYPICEAQEQYHVELRLSGGSAMLRLMVVDDVAEVVYSLGAFNADSGLVASDIPTLDVVVYQISGVVGRGYPGTAIV